MSISFKISLPTYLSIVFFHIILHHILNKNTRLTDLFRTKAWILTYILLSLYYLSLLSWLSNLLSSLLKLLYFSLLDVLKQFTTTQFNELKTSCWPHFTVCVHKVPCRQLAVDNYNAVYREYDVIFLERLKVMTYDGAFIEPTISRKSAAMPSRQ